jgi:hypothetical protein
MDQRVRHGYMQCQATVICVVSVEIAPYFKAFHIVHVLEAVTPGSFHFISGAV